RDSTRNPESASAALRAPSILRVPLVEVFRRNARAVIGQPVVTPRTTALSGGILLIFQSAGKDALGLKPDEDRVHAARRNRCFATTRSKTRSGSNRDSGYWTHASPTR